MPHMKALPDDFIFECSEGETLLQAALRSKLQLTHICGGKAKCSTCRIWVLDGLEECGARTDAEEELAQKLGLDPRIRLACQLRPKSDLAFRRLVLDETDIAIANQISRDRHTNSGQLKEVAVFFSDIQGFTEFSENLTPFDVMYLLNRYFAQVGEVIENNFGFIDKFVGDGMMAIFGIEDQADAPLRAVNAGLQSLAAVDRMKPFFESMYGIDFDVRIGIHWGEAVIGSVGFPGHERLTAMGDVVNLASRVEAANKEAGTRFLITEALYQKIEDDVEVADFLRVRLRGTTERVTLYEIKNLKPGASERINAAEERDTKRIAGRMWSRLIPVDEFREGERRIFEFQNLDLVVIRREGQFYAFNNACPHVKLPLFNRTSNIDDPEKLRPDESEEHEGEVVCRWHKSRFDLVSGEVISWCEALHEDGTPPGMEMLGDISKNRSPLHVYRTRVEDRHLWVSFDM
jgi:class 3 adenylate cyclase/nitrite reductase/ring-hydroxylating ferredoxin subunit